MIKKRSVNIDYCNNSSIKIAYLESGRKYRETIIFLDLYLNKEGFKGQLKKLHKRFHCIALDLPGFGESDKPEITDEIVVPPTSYDFQYSYGWFCARLNSFIEKLRIRNPTLCGVDQAGNIAVCYAQRYKVDRLILQNTTPFPVVSNNGCFSSGNLTIEGAQALTGAFSAGGAMKESVCKLFSDALHLGGNRSGKCVEGMHYLSALTKESMMKISSELFSRLFLGSFTEDLTPELSKMTNRILHMVTAPYNDQLSNEMLSTMKFGQRPWFNPDPPASMPGVPGGKMTGCDCDCEDQCDEPCGNMKRVIPPKRAQIFEDANATVTYHAFNVKNFNREVIRFYDGTGCNLVNLKSGDNDDWDEDDSDDSDDSSDDSDDDLRLTKKKSNK